MNNSNPPVAQGPYDSNSILAAILAASNNQSSGSSTASFGVRQQQEQMLSLEQARRFLGGGADNSGAAIGALLSSLQHQPAGLWDFSRRDVGQLSSLLGGNTAMLRGPPGAIPGRGLMENAGSIAAPQHTDSGILGQTSLLSSSFPALSGNMRGFGNSAGAGGAALSHYNLLLTGGGLGHQLHNQMPSQNMIMDARNILSGHPTLPRPSTSTTPAPTNTLYFLGFRDFEELQGVDLVEFAKDNATTLNFPQKLMLMLTHVDREKAKGGFGTGAAAAEPPISWTQDGNAFMIRSRKRFVAEILPLFFREAKFPSFTRKLYRWGFRQICIPTKGKKQQLDGSASGGRVEEQFEEGRTMIFGHEYFLRDDKALMSKMKSVTAAGRRRAEEEQIDHEESNQQRKTRTGSPCDDHSSLSEEGAASSSKKKKVSAKLKTNDNDKADAVISLQKGQAGTSDVSSTSGDSSSAVEEGAGGGGAAALASNKGARAAPEMMMSGTSLKKADGGGSSKRRPKSLADQKQEAKRRKIFESTTKIDTTIPVGSEGANKASLLPTTTSSNNLQQLSQQQNPGSASSLLLASILGQNPQLALVANLQQQQQLEARRLATSATLTVDPHERADLERQQEQLLAQLLSTGTSSSSTSQQPPVAAVRGGEEDVFVGRGGAGGLLLHHNNILSNNSITSTTSTTTGSFPLLAQLLNGLLGPPRQQPRELVQNHAAVDSTSVLQQLLLDHSGASRGHISSNTNISTIMAAAAAVGGGSESRIGPPQHETTSSGTQEDVFSSLLLAALSRTGSSTTYSSSTPVVAAAAATSTASGGGNPRPQQQQEAASTLSLLLGSLTKSSRDSQRGGERTADSARYDTSPSLPQRAEEQEQKHHS